MRGRAGFSLIEVTIAVAILGVSLAVLLTSAATCLQVLSYAARYQEAQRVRGLAAAEFPLVVSNDLAELNVPETRYAGDVIFSREVDESADDEAYLFVVTTRIAWTERGMQRTDEVRELVYFKDDDAP